MHKHNIDNPNHPHYIKTDLSVGTPLVPTDPDFVKGMQLHQDGHLTFAVGGTPTRTENADGSVTDILPVARTYHPNPKK
jgi:hypothetical protein